MQLTPASWAFRGLVAFGIQLLGFGEAGQRWLMQLKPDPLGRGRRRMGYVATDLARIPGAGFEWYAYVLSDGWNDPFRAELAQNFDRFAAAVGPDCLVVRGANPESFYNDILSSELMKLATQGQPPLPALVVSNRTPGGIDDGSGTKNLDGVRLLIFPLSQRYVKPGSITDFLKSLAATLKEGGAGELDEETLRSKWRWLAEYLELKPNFCGVGVNLTKVLDGLFDQKR